MTAVCPSESSPEGAEVGARTAGTRGSGAAGTTGSISVAGVGESNADSVGGSIGGTAVVTVGQRYNRWSRQDSSDINTDDEGATIRRLTPLERLNLDMCQDERWGSCDQAPHLPRLVEFISYFDFTGRWKSYYVGKTVGFRKKYSVFHFLLCNLATGWSAS